MDRHRGPRRLALSAGALPDVEHRRRARQQPGGLRSPRTRRAASGWAARRPAALGWHGLREGPPHRRTGPPCRCSPSRWTAGRTRSGRAPRTAPSTSSRTGPCGRCPRRASPALPSGLASWTGRTRLWVGEPGAAACCGWPTASASPWTRQPGLASNTVIALLEDPEGNLWIGTARPAGCTASRTRPSPPMGPPEGLAHDMVLAIREARDGSLWFAGLGSGVTRWHDGQMQHVDDARGAHPRPRPLHRRGARRQHLVRHADGPQPLAATGKITTSLWDRPGPALGCRCAWSFVDTRGHALGRHPGGAARWNGEHFEPFTREQGLPGNAITLLKQRPAGGFWVGTAEGGLAYFIHGRPVLWPPRASRCSARSRRSTRSRTARSGSAPTRASTAGRNGALPALLARGGPLRRSHLPDPPGRARPPVDELQQGHLPRVPAGAGGRGRGAARARHLPRLRRGRWDARRGVQRLGLPAGHQRPAMGRLWFPTIRGAVVYDPDGRGDARAARAAGALRGAPRGRAGRAPPRVGAASPRARAGWSSTTPPPACGPRSGCSFRYRLEGMDSDWVEAGAGAWPTYTHLPPGHYRFQVAGGYAGRRRRRSEAALSVLPGSPASTRRGCSAWRAAGRRAGGGRRGVAAPAPGAPARARAAGPRGRAHRRAGHRQRGPEARLAGAAGHPRAARPRGEDGGGGHAGRGRGARDQQPAGLHRLQPRTTLAAEVRDWRAQREGSATRWEEVEQALDEALQGADRVRRIVQDLRTFSRMQPERTRSRVDLHGGAGAGAVHGGRGDPPPRPRGEGLRRAARRARGRDAAGPGVPQPAGQRRPGHPRGPRGPERDPRHHARGTSRAAPWWR